MIMSQSSRENATSSSGTALLASYKEVPLPSPPTRKKMQNSFYLWAPAHDIRYYHVSLTVTHFLVYMGL